MNQLPRSVSKITLSFALPAMAGAATLRAQTTAPYPELDHVQGTLIQTAAAPVRPLWIDSTGDVWAVNTALNTVEQFRTLDQPALDIRQVPWGPVSIAQWDDPAPSVGPELLIVCRNTWGVLRMDRATGAHKEFIPVPAEPSDIVVDAVNQRAFVSCTGADAVVEIDLTLRDGQFHRRWDESTTGGELRMKSPYFLSLTNEKVTVAPLHSGNNTTVPQAPFGRPSTVIKLSDPLPGGGQRANQLPDEDLFRITPGPNGTPPDASQVQVIATGVGTILFAHGSNPADSRYWVLNTDARNADPAAQSEPALNFDFVDNRVTRLGPTTFTPFDPGDPGFTTGNAIGQPFALLFHQSSGQAFVAGLLTDNVTLLSSSAAFELEIVLPDGSIPRGLAFPSPLEEAIAVYCWGTARIEVYKVDYAVPSAIHIGGYSLSHDPLPQDHKDGREIFFDGHLSFRTNVSCASCHIDGGTDFLAWNLSGAPFDDKGPMVTQTLIGLERVGPFHWRGERTFEEFNERGFPGLLGHPALDAAEFAKMKAWVFSLRNPANPFQSRDRVVDQNTPASQFVAPTQTRAFQSSLPPDLRTLNPAHPFVQNPTVPDSASSTSAVDGLADFQDPSKLIFQNRFTCIHCHTFPIGTNNDITDDESQAPPLIPERLHFKNTPFHEIWRKKQSLVLADTQEPPLAQFIDVRTFLGAGVQHAGSVPDVLRFAQAAAPNTGVNAGFSLTVAPFMQQWDQGLSPAAHFAYWLDSTSTPAEVTSELQQFLLAQASTISNPLPAMPYCDIAVLQILAGSRETWYLDRSLAGSTIAMSDVVFSVDSHTSPEPRSLQSFVDQAATAPALIIGLPVGMAERFAVDYDMDLNRNRDDASPYVPNPAPNGPPAFTRKQLGFVTTNTARVYVETNEPTTLVVSYREDPSDPFQTATSPMLSRVHSVLLPGLRPSTSVDDGAIDPETVDYEVSLTATDGSNLQVTEPLVGGVPATEPFTMPLAAGNPAVSPVEQIGREHVLADPPTVSIGPLIATTRMVTVQVTAEFKQGLGTVPASNRVFVLRAYRQRPGQPLLQLTGTSGIPSVVSGTRLAGNVLLDDVDDGLSTTRQLGISGGLILNTAPSDATGLATLRFRVANATVTSGDTVVVNVEAAVDASGSTPVSFQQPCTLTTCVSATILTPYLTGFSQWDFPRTTEDNFQGEALVP